MTIGTRTLVTAANLTAVQYTHVRDGLQAQDFSNMLTPAAIAFLNNLVKWDNQGALSQQDFDPNTSLQPFFNALAADGILNIPARGRVKVREGDIIAVDTATGWPILVAAAAAAGAGWTLSGVTA